MNGLDFVRLLLEVIVMIMNLMYFFNTVHELRKVLASNSGNRRCGKQCLWVLEGSFRFLVLDPFHLLDLISTVSLFVMMLDWYSFVFSTLRQYYVFAETR